MLPRWLGMDARNCALFGESTMRLLRRSILMRFGFVLVGCSASCADRVQQNVAYAEADVDTAWVSDTSAGFSSILGMAPSPGGGVFVLDNQEVAVSELTALGKVKRKFGSRGYGPGEFSRPVRVGLYSDSLWVADMESRSITLFPLRDSGGVSTRAPFVPADGERLRPVLPIALMTDGSVIVTASGRIGTVGDGIRDTIFHIAEGEWSVIGSATRVVQWQFPGEEKFLKRFNQPFTFSDGWSRATDGSAFVFVQTSAAMLVREGKFIVNRQDFVDHTSWQVDVPYSPRRLEQTSIDSVVRRNTKGFPEQFDAARDSLFKPKTWPPVRGIIAGRFGAIWIQRYDLDGNRWQSVSPDSTQRRMIALPSNFEPFVFSHDSIWGVLRDEVDLPSVALMTIRPGNRRTSDKK